MAMIDRRSSMLRDKRSMAIAGMFHPGDERPNERDVLPCMMTSYFSVDASLSGFISWATSPSGNRKTAMTESSGREIKVYDDSRRPRNWHELLAPSQCAVFFKRIDSVQPLSPVGDPVAFRDCTFLLFDKLEEARRFCEAKVMEFPQISCEIFTSRGKAEPPLLTILHPSAAEKDEMSASSERKRLIVAAVLFLGALLLIWWDWRTRSGLVIPTLLGINMIFAALRLLQWNSARSQRLSEQAKRLQAHLETERRLDAMQLDTGGIKSPSALD
jgi:hypothetical protein